MWGREVLGVKKSFVTIVTFFFSSPNLNLLHSWSAVVFQDILANIVASCVVNLRKYSRGARGVVLLLADHLCLAILDPRKCR